MDALLEFKLQELVFTFMSEHEVVYGKLNVTGAEASAPHVSATDLVELCWRALAVGTLDALPTSWPAAAPISCPECGSAKAEMRSDGRGACDCGYYWSQEL